MNGKNITPGVLWTTILTVIPLVVAFLNGLGTTGMVNTSIVAAIVIALTSAARIIEVFKPIVEDAQVVGNAAAPINARNRRTVWSRILLGG